MNHRVSIVVSNTSTESGLGSPEVCSKASCSCLSKSVKKNVCIAHFFFIVKPCAEFTCYSPLVLCHSFSFSGQRSTVVPGHARTKHSSPWIGSFRPFLLALFFLFLFLPTDHSQSSVTVVCVLRASSCWWKKIWLPNVTMCFRRRHSIRAWRTHVWRKSTNRIVHVVFPYTFRRPALRFRSFSIKPVESARSSSIGFSFSAFFLWVRWNRNDTRAWSETTPKAWLRNPNTYAYFYCLIADGVRLLVNRWLFFNIFKTASSALSMLTKTYML